jgi:rod shape determining protein RodA
VVAVVASVHWLAISIWIVILVFLLLRSRLSWVAITVASIINIFVSLIMPVFWMGLKDYQQNRILTFLDPTRDPLGAGYQIIQAKIAIGSGSLTGKGWLMGTQKNMNFLPEHHTDFIFSVIGEEFGFVGSMFILLVFVAFFGRIIYNIGQLKVRERKVAASGILAYLMFQSFINIGMNIGLVPATGIPLPFISYGGSNLLINSVSVAVILKYLNERGFIK